MRKVVYLVDGQEITSYAKAREIQPTGQLKVRFDKIREEAKTSPETLKKRMTYFAKRRAEKAATAN